MNPFKDVEMYLIPLIVAAASWVIAQVVDASCSSDFCESTESAFKRLYLFILFCLFAVTYRHLSGMFAYIKEILPGLLQSPLAARVAERPSS